MTVILESPCNKPGSHLLTFLQQHPGSGKCVLLSSSEVSKSLSFWSSTSLASVQSGSLHLDLGIIMMFTSSSCSSSSRSTYHIQINTDVFLSLLTLNPHVVPCTFTSSSFVSNTSLVQHICCCPVIFWKNFVVNRVIYLHFDVSRNVRCDIRGMCGIIRNNCFIVIIISLINWCISRYISVWLSCNLVVSGVAMTFSWETRTNESPWRTNTICPSWTKTLCQDLAICHVFLVCSKPGYHVEILVWQLGFWWAEPCESFHQLLTERMLIWRHEGHSSV